MLSKGSVQMRSGGMPLPPDEDERLAAVRRYDILEDSLDQALERVTGMVARLLRVPMAFLSIVERDNIRLLARHGLTIPHTDREPGLCASAILLDGPYVVNDAATDERTASHGWVVGDIGLRFYAGVPLTTPDGHRLGVLCAADRQARSVSPDDLAILEDLASMVADRLELRRSAPSVVAQLSEAIAEKDRALKRADLMKQETDHRIMNSLQLVSSLLLLQSRSVSSEEAAEHLKSAASRVSTVAQVHRYFYLDENIETVPSLTYLKNLCAGLSSMLRLNSLDVRGQDMAIPAKQIVPIGLIVNEFVTNAAKYGGGQIDVSLYPMEGTSGYVLSVADEGPGLEAGFDPRKNTGLGMKVVRVLAQQLGGRLKVGSGANGRGAKFSVTVSADPS